MPESAAPATGRRPTTAWFDGILTGPIGDVAALRAAVDALNRGGVVSATLDLDGGRFSLLFDDALFAPERLDAATSRDLAANLQRVADAAAPHASVESTLRCTLVRADDVTETLFVVQGRKVQGLSCTRPRRSEDDARAAPPPSPLGTSNVSRGHVVAIGVGFLLLFVLFAWKSGYVDRLFAPSGDGLPVTLGDFDGVVKATVESKWGDFEVKLVRGPRWPTTVEEGTRLVAEATTPAARAAMQVVTNGGDVYVRLENGHDEVLEAVKVELRPLVARSDGEAKATLHGRIVAARVRLDLDQGPPPK
jgi:hypothetical protein